MCVHTANTNLSKQDDATQGRARQERERERGREGERELSDSEKAEYAGARKQTKKNI